MSAAAILGIVLGILGAGAPVLEKAAPTIVAGVFELPRASQDEQTLGRLLRLYEMGSPALRSQVRIHVTALSPRPLVAVMLPPIWAARTPFERALALALIRREIERP